LNPASESNYNERVRVLILSAMLDFALLLFPEALRFGCSPEYERITAPEEVEKVLGDRPWDVLIGVWRDLPFAAAVAAIALREPGFDAHSVVLLNYAGAAMLAVTREGHSAVMRESHRLVAALDGLLRELPGLSAMGDVYAPSLPLTLLEPATGSYAVDAAVTESTPHLNSLLTVIIGCGEILLEKFAGDASGTRYLQELLAAAARAEELVADIMSVSPVLGPRTVDVGSTLAESREILLAIAGEGLILEIQMSAGPAIVALDHRQVRKLITDMVAIARLLMPQGGVLKVAVGQMNVTTGRQLFPVLPGEYVSIDFSYDQSATGGLGTETSLYPIFASKEYASELGFASVHNFLEQTGGHLAVSKEAGRRITVTLLLPAVRPHKLAPLTFPSQTGPDRGTPKPADARKVIEAALRVLSASARRGAWNVEDELLLRRWSHDIRSRIEAVACGVLQRELAADSPE
jgi:hypothetical protein